MDTNTFKVGDKVLFGRTHGETTLGTVVKVNRVKLKVRQDETRGTFRAYPVGTVWNVPVSLCRKTEPGPAGWLVAVEPKPAPKRPEAEVLKDILGVYCQLSPENLSCDGELPMAAVRRRAASLNARLQALFVELGRRVSESEVYALSRLA